MVAAAARLLRRQGYTATGWRQVVAEGSAPWGSQSHFFPDGKEQLAAEALAGEGERVRRELETALRTSHPADMVLAWSHATAAQLAESGWEDGCPVATTALETAHTSDRLAAVCHDAFSSWRAAFADSMAARGTDIETAEALATLVVAATEGAILLARTSRDPAPLHAVADELATLLRDRVP